MHNYELHKQRKDNPVNFYINIDKLKNLQISGRDSLRLHNNQTALKSNSLQSNNRKSLLLRQTSNQKKEERKGTMHSSY